MVVPSTHAEKAVAAIAPAPAQFYRQELDLVRFAAFFAVFLHHALPQDADPWVGLGLPPLVARWIGAAVTAGSLGVDLFFVLSAYLITELLLRERAVRGSIDIGRFYLRRTFRIWPLYFTFLAFAAFVLPHFIPAQRLGPRYTIPFFLFMANWATAKYDYPPSVAAPLWSVSIEEQFYVAWPLILRWISAARIVPFLGFLLLVASGCRAVLVIMGVRHPGIWCNTLARLDPIAIGALVAVLLNRGMPAMRTVTRVILVVGGAFVLVFSVRYLAFAGPRALLLYPLTAVACGAILVAFLGVKVPRSRVFDTFCWLGQVSYGLYVFHFYGLYLLNVLSVRGVVKVNGSLWLRVAAAFALTLAFSAASYLLLERPFIRLKRRFAHIVSSPNGDGHRDTS